MIETKINTPFKQVKDFVNHISKPIFFSKIIEEINPITYKYIPNIHNIERIQWPQTIEYEEVPKFRFFYLPRVKIIQTWKLENNCLKGDITGYRKNIHFMSIKVNISFKKKNTVMCLMETKWIYKSNFIPNFVLNDISSKLTHVFFKTIN